MSLFRFNRKQSSTATPAVPEQAAKQQEKTAPTRKRNAWFAAGAAGLIAVSIIAGQQYVKAHTVEVFHVYVANKEAGTVSSPKVVDQFIQAKNEAVKKQHPNVNMAVNDDQLSIKSEKAYKAKSDNAAAFKQLDRLLEAKAAGIQVKVNGKVIGTVKDQATADYILNRVRTKFAPSLAKKQNKAVTFMRLASVSEKTGTAKTGTAKTGTAKSSPAVGRTMKYVQVMEKLSTDQVTVTDPNQVKDAAAVLATLFSGAEKPVKYIVKEGDCVGCIANRFDIPKEQLYKNNPWIEDDMIKVGDTLDLTVKRPAVNVKTIEQVVERHEIEHSVIYQYDKTLKKGKMKRVQQGANGSKKVIYKLTKLNGLVLDEEVVGQEVERKSIPEIILKGTKVVIEEGTGVFSYPVSNARLTSTFGKRWGRQHKGIDLVGGSTIKAADNGKVIFAGVKSGYGNCVIVDHQNGYQTLYGHLRSISVSEGTKVGKGQKLGVMGSTGHSTGVHLHFEVYKNGVLKNPLSYL
ncbi:peptidoglycan DD-metalloendopeptidase family protein [Paenibacillus gansuensis]|uniref:Peptidoglycan DD-metalloendopeptidase family protein n=1 Tax=Paenibacillus gansuensis TaxID=306542 RepID=A0ABW5PJR6_9BACL